MNTRSSNGNSKQLGSYVRRLREEAGKSVRGLAGEAGVDPTWLSKLERGLREAQEPRMLSRLAYALDIEPVDLFLAAGYQDGRGLPSFGTYLRARYDLPDEAIRQLEAHFDLIDEKYRDNQTRREGP